MKGFQHELTENILPFWIHQMQDKENGGFYGRIDGKNVRHPYANKGAVLNCRILWTFSAAYRILKKEEYLKMAERAYQYIREYFIDKKYGGVYWELTYTGEPVQTKKQTYAQGFALYAFSEYYRITGNPEALHLAKEIFRIIETYRDKEECGYFEAFTEDWQPIADMRLSEKDANEKKTMNTHLHLLEPYTNLLRVWNHEEVKAAHREIMDIFVHRIIDPKARHLRLFFDEQWNCKSDIVSFGHDIEASWLLVEAAEVSGDKGFTEKIKTLSLQIAEAASGGIMADGSMIYETESGQPDGDRHWWVQAEAVVGYMYAYRNSGNVRYGKYAENVWSYIRAQMIDRENGEWYWSRKADGRVNGTEDKAGFWKCPYHNGRMCLEMIENFGIKD